MLLAAGASGVALIALLPTLTGIARERWSATALRPVFTEAAISALAPGVVALAFRAPPEWALPITLGGGAFAIARLGMRYTPMRTIKRLTRALTHDAERAGAIAAIGPALDRGRPAGNDPALGAWAHAVLVAAAYLVDADEAVAARGVLERASGVTFVGISIVNQTLIWAHIELLCRDPVKARSALDSIGKPIALPLLAAHADGLEALVLACEGEGLAALSRIESWKHADNWYAKLRLTARAVAHASRGETQLRERTEHELERRFGARALSVARSLADSAPSTDAD